MAEESGANGASPKIKLDVGTIKALWSQTYNTQGKPDWSHIYP